MCADAAADGQHDDGGQSDGGHAAAAAGCGGRGVLGRAWHRADPLHQPLAMMLVLTSQ